MALVNMEYNSLKVVSKILKARHLVIKLTDNPHFPVPNPSLAELANAANELENANIEAHSRATVAIKERDASEKRLNKLVSTLGAYIQSESKGEPAIIRSAGVGVKADPSKAGNLNAPVNMLAKISGKEGCINLKWSPVKGAKCYIIEITSDLSGSEWIIADVCTTAKFTIGKLVSGKKYWFRVKALNGAGKSIPSDPAFGMAG